MALLYRMVCAVDGDIVTCAPELFGSWIAWKHPDLEVPDGGQRTAGQNEVRVRRDAGNGVRAWRAELREERTREHWTTTFTAMADNSESWAWIDLERSADQPFGRPSDLYPPRLLGNLLSAVPCQSGSIPLTAEHTLIDESESVHEWVQELCNPERLIPLVVVSPRNSSPAGGDEASTCAGLLARRVAGVARVYVFSAQAIGLSQEHLPKELWVYGGAVRTYLPQLDVHNPQPWRHRYVPPHRLVDDHAAARIVGAALFRASALARPPKLYRDQVRFLPGLRSAGTDVEWLFEEATELDTMLTEALEENEGLHEELELAVLELREHQLENSQLRRDLDQTRRRVAYHEGATSAEPTAENLPQSVEGCVVALETAERLLADVTVTSAAMEAARALDGHAKGRVWGDKAWRALQTMQRYIAAVHRGDNSCESLRSFVLSGLAGADTIPGDWVALTESETTRQNPRFIGARTFPVDTRVDPSGRVFMEARIKVEKGGGIAPRLHFYDDSQGQTGKIHIGYFGPHPRNKATN